MKKENEIIKENQDEIKGTLNKNQTKDEEELKEQNVDKEAVMTETAEDKDDTHEFATEEEFARQLAMQDNKEQKDITAEENSYTEQSENVAGEADNDATQDTADEKGDEWYKNDRELFIKKYPDVNIDNLINDEYFNLFAGGKVGIKSLTTIYEDYNKLIGELEKKAMKKVEIIMANKTSSPGTLSSSEPNETLYYTKEQVMNMSETDVRKNYDKIRKSMTKWIY